MQIGEGNTRAWILRYQIDGRARHMGLGSAKWITLAQAREKAREAMAQVVEGIDPIAARKRAKQTRMAETAAARSFKDCAAAYIASHEAGWRNAQSSVQWRQSLADYVFPHFGDMAVGDIDTGMVLTALESLWKEKPETASRVRGRIEAVLDWAKARGFRNGGENPARWKGHLDHLLPARHRVQSIQHFAALPYKEVPAFMTRLRGMDETPARMMEFLVLTAARSGEVLGARWDEIDGDSWLIPAKRMKAGKPHRIPLCSRARAILAAQPRGNSELVFPGARGGAPSIHLFKRLLDRMGHRVTTHGFRSSFRDWAAETSSFPNHVVEAALAHTISNAVEAAYRRGDLIEKRRELMAAWDEFLAAP
jgi:integrase